MRVRVSAARFSVGLCLPSSPAQRGSRRASAQINPTEGNALVLHLLLFCVSLSLTHNQRSSCSGILAHKLASSLLDGAGGVGGVAEVSAAARWSTRAGEGGSPLGFREGGEEEEEATTAAAPDGCGRLRAFAPLLPFSVPKTKSHERLFRFHVPSR